MVFVLDKIVLLLIYKRGPGFDKFPFPKRGQISNMFLLEALQTWNKANCILSPEGSLAVCPAHYFCTIYGPPRDFGTYCIGVQQRLR